MNIILHSDTCIACGACAAVAPNLFSIGTGVVTLKKDPSSYTQEDKKTATSVASLCPNGVIEIIEK